MTKAEQLRFFKDITMVPNVRKYYDLLGGSPPHVTLSTTFPVQSSLA
jgi:hypothetical protein